MSLDEAVTSSSTERDPLEQLAEEFLERRRQGESASIDDYAEQYPALAQRIRDLFPTLLLMEQLKPSSTPSPEGRAAVPLPRSGSVERLGDFRIVREIGRGGMGVVYEAEQESLGRRVALKVLPAVYTASPSRLRRFHREARAAARLHHTNIVPIFGVGEQEGLHYYVMQLIAGRGLDRILGALSSSGTDASTLACGEQFPAEASDGPGEAIPAEEVAQMLLSGRLAPEAGPPESVCRLQTPEAAAGRPPLVMDHLYWRAVARMGVQVADALQYAHQQGTLHRDIKPSNLLLDNRGTVWVADFGLAKLADLEDVTHSGDVVGTLRYMAPEQFAGKADARSDVYSLGLTLYELLTLRPAFDETDRGRLIRQVTQEEPPRPGKLNPAIPRDLETILVKAIAPNPAHRYQTAGELAADLTCFLEDRPIRARRTTPLGRLWRWCRRNRAVAALAGTALGLLVAVAVVASIGYIRTTRALERESHQRAQAELARRQAEEERTRTAAEHHRAEANLRLATKAFEDIFTKVAADPIIQAPDADGEDDEPWVPPAWEHAVTDKDAALLESLLKFYDQFAQQNRANVKLQKETARAYRRVGDIQRRLGQYEKAEAAYRHALESYQPLAQASPEDAESSTATAAIYNGLGVVFCNTGRWSEARQSHLHAQEVLGKQPPQVAKLAESRFELARTYSFLSFMFPGPRPPRGNGPGARRPPGPPSDWGGERAENNRKAREILKQLIDEAPDNPRYRLAMARCQRDLSRMAPFTGQADQAQQARQEAIGLLEKLVADFPANPEYRYELAETLAMAHPRWREAAPSAGSVDPLRRAIEIGAALVARYPTVPEYKAALGRWHVALGEVQRRAGALADAEASLAQGVGLHKRLVADFPAVNAHRFLLARAFHQLAEVQTSRKEPDKARITLEESITNLKKIQESLSGEPQTGLVAGMISWNYTTLAKVLRQLGEDAQADEAAAKAQEAAAKAKQAAERLGPPRFGPFRFDRERPGQPK